MLAELLAGGALITDPLPASACPRGPSSEIGYRTFVQLDGDICTSIHARALACPEFAATYNAHLQHVQTLLGERISWLLRQVRKLRWCVAFAGLGLTLYAPSSWIELADVSTRIAWTLAVAPLVAWLLSILTRWLVHRWLRWLVHRRLRQIVQQEPITATPSPGL